MARPHIYMVCLLDLIVIQVPSDHRPEYVVGRTSYVNYKIDIRGDLLVAHETAINPQDRLRRKTHDVMSQKRFQP